MTEGSNEDVWFPSSVVVFTDSVGKMLLIFFFSVRFRLDFLKNFYVVLLYFLHTARLV